MNRTHEVSDGPYQVSTDISKLDVNVIHKYLSEESYWAKGIPRDVLEKAIIIPFVLGCIITQNRSGLREPLPIKQHSHTWQTFLFCPLIAARVCPNG
jgi:hypothetical protein